MAIKIIPMNYHYQRYPLTRFLDYVQASPFGKEIDLYCAAPQVDILHCTVKEILEVEGQLTRRGIAVNTMTPENFAYPISFAAKDPLLISASLQYYQKAIDIAEFLGCPRVQISIGTGYFSENPQEPWKRCRENLELLVKYCQRKKVVLLLEELKTTSSNVINTSQDLARMLQEVDSPNLMGMMDIDQMATCGETPRDYFSRLGAKMQHIHFNDCDHTVPGDGGYPMKEFYKSIKESGYAGTLTFEICARKYFCEPDRAMTRIWEWLQQNAD